MARLETWFPTAIYLEDNLFDNAQNLEWKTYCIQKTKDYKSGGDEWEGGTFTSHSSKYNLLEDAKFSPLINAVTLHVNKFVTMHNSFKKYECESAWFNLSYNNNFQEMHTHGESTLSAIYYVATPENSGKLVFEDPREPDMLPIKNITTRNFLSFVKVGYEPIEGQLIIFRSYLRHMVTVNKCQDPRISIAFNF